MDRTKLNVGDLVTYIPFGKGASPDQQEHGKVKEVKENGAVVVYKCNNEWSKWKDYAGEWTGFHCLTKGWI